MGGRNSSGFGGAAATVVATGLIAVALLALVVLALGVGHDETARALPEQGPTGTTATTTTTTTYHVGTAGCSDSATSKQALDPETPWCTVSHAATAAPDGATILIAPGTYAKLEADGPRRNLHFAPLDPSDRPLIQGADLEKVEGYTFTGLLFGSGFGVTRGSDIEVRDNGFASSGIYIRQSQRVLIAQNRIRHLHGAERGIMLQGSYAAGAPTNQQITITQNLIEDSDHDAIGVYNGYQTLMITKNRIMDVHQPPHFRYHSDGLQMMGGDGATVQGNVIQDVTHGIIVKDGAATTHLLLRGNLVEGVKGAALQLYNVPGALIEGNTFWRALLGVVLDNAAGAPGSTSARLVGNVMLDLSPRSPGAVASATGNVFGRGKTVGRPAYRGTPNFQNPSGGDYRLSTNRPGSGIPRGATVGAQLQATPGSG